VTARIAVALTACAALASACSPAATRVKHGTPHTHAGDPLHDWIVVAEPKDDAA